jgi:hypothetical protein
MRSDEWARGIFSAEMAAIVMMAISYETAAHGPRADDRASAERPINPKPPEPAPPPKPQRPAPAPPGIHIPTECEINGGRAGLTDQNSFPLYVISAHHGSRPGSPPPDGLDLREAAAKFLRFWTYDPNTVISFPASPGGSTGDGYLFPASTYFINQVNQTTNSRPPLNPVLAGEYGESGNTGAATSSNWSVSQIQESNYPKAIQGGEGKDYGVFVFSHAPSGFQMVIIAATLENGNPPLEAQQVTYLLTTAAAPYRNSYPTFIAADLNFGADDPNAAIVTSKLCPGCGPAATWINEKQPCENVAYTAFAPGTGTIMNLLLVNGSGAARVQPRVIRFDPDKVGRATVPDPGAGDIVLAQQDAAGSGGLAGNHPVLAITFKMLPSSASCPPGTRASSVCWKEGDPPPVWVPRCHEACVNN